MLGLAAAIFAVFLLPGCGGGGNGDGGGGGGGDSASRGAAVEDAMAAFAALNGLTPEAENQAMLAWFQSRPDFLDAGITDGCAWAHYRDHTTVVIGNNRQVIDDGTRAVSAAAGRLALELPGVKQARVINNFGGGNAAANNKIVAMLQANGYSVTPGPVDIAGLLAVGGDGVFYIDSHGLSITEDDGKDTFYLMADEPYVAAQASTHNAALNDHRLALWLSKDAIRQADGSIKVETNGKYLVSDRLLAGAWGQQTFGRNSFVFINACSSARTELVSALCFAKGASLFAGWSGDVFNDHAGKVAPFVFDRMLGANKVAPEADGDQRPFDYLKMYQDLLLHGLRADAGGVEIILRQKPGTDFGLLAPTISVMLVDERQKELTIQGVFGTEPGTVTVGGAEVAVKNWGFNSLVCDLPAGLSGEVIVEVREHKSNVVRLTEWKARFRTRFDPQTGGSLKQEGVLEVNFRADVHAHREEPHQAPLDPLVLFEEEEDSKGKFTASGVLVAPTTTITWGGTADLVPLQVGGPAAGRLVCLGSIDVIHKKIDIALQAISGEGMTNTISPGGTFPLPGSTGLLDGEFSPENPIPTLRLALNEDFSIDAGVREEINSGARFRLEWDKITPLFPPDKQAARSAVTRKAR